MMSHKIFFSLISVFIICTSGCTMPIQEKQDDEYLGCEPGEKINDEEESCSINSENNDNEITLFDNKTESEENTDLTNDEQPTNQTQNEEINNIGTYEGMNVPNFESLVHYYNSTEWSEFELYSQFNESWNSSQDNLSKWTVLIFISTDCSHCWNAGEYIGQLSEVYKNQTQFFILAVNFSSNNNFNATPEEIVAFQEKNDYFGCYSNTKNCNERPGEPHQFPYIDDRNQSIMYDWDVTGTPAQFIIKPNGIMEWNVYQHRTSNGGDGENFEQALNRIFS